MSTEKQIQLPICSSCNRPIMPGERAVKFYCPNCGEVLIWRNEKCRRFSRPYRCVNCSYEGP